MVTSLCADGFAILQTLRHEAVEGDDEVGVLEDALVDEFKSTRGEAGWLDFSQGEELIGVEVHCPVHRRHTADGGREGADQADHRRRGGEEDPGEARREEAAEKRLGHEGGRAQNSQQDVFLAEGGEGEAADFNVIDRFAGGINSVGIFKAPAGGVDEDAVTAARQFIRNVGDVLADGGRVGNEDLGDDENSLTGHSVVLEEARMTKSEDPNQ